MKTAPSADRRVRFATYLGGPADYSGTTIVVDARGNMYVGGTINSSNLPPGNSGVLPYRRDGGFVVKLAAGGTRLAYRVYLPGIVTGVAVDSHGNAYVTGSTSATNFPTRHAFQNHANGGTCGMTGLVMETRLCSDAFVTKLSPTGQFLYSTYLGGSADDAGTGIAVNSRGEAYVTGTTGSADFPTRHAVQPRYAGPFHGQANPAGTDLSPCCDAFVARFSVAGKLIFSTYLGGSGIDIATGIAVDRSGNTYVGGITESTDFPVFDAMQSKLPPPDPNWGWGTSPFATKLSPEGRIIYSTYFGGSGPTRAAGIGVDATGAVILAGSTASKSLPTMHAIQTTIQDPNSEDPFVARLDPHGRLVYSTYLGGSAYGEAHGVAATPHGEAIVVGRVEATDFPLVNPLRGVKPRGPFGAELSVQGPPLRFSSYLGDLVVHAVAADGKGNIYLTGDTTSKALPTVRPVQPQPAGDGFNAFVMRIHV